MQVTEYKNHSEVEICLVNQEAVESNVSGTERTRKRT